MKLIEKLADALLSGEFLAMLFAGGTGFLWAAYRKGKETAKTREADLARAKFKLENAATTKAAVHEGLTEIKDLLIPTIQHLQREIAELRRSLSLLDARCDEALQLAKTLEKSQGAFFRTADIALGQILSGPQGKTFLRTYYEEPNGNQDGDRT
jgi:hypothetical protein